MEKPQFGLSSDELRSLDELLEANGLEMEQLQNAPDTISHIEMFLHQYPRMLGIQAFQHLKSLSLINQEIKEIEGLGACTSLEKLYLIENHIKKIKGLDMLINLKELYLYSNHIAKIENISTLSKLEILWLSDNNITVIEGLTDLPVLRDLNLARNEIVVIGDSLAHNTALQVLNLSDNYIGSFKEFCPLVNLPLLTDLCFADPMWGECPLSGLCNYQTFVLFMLPKLKSLDTLLLAEETKTLAEATFLKKQMYYNMRIKTMRRNARNLIKMAADGKKLALQQRQSAVDRLTLQQKDLEREVSEGGGDENRVEALKAKLRDINYKLTTYNQQRAVANVSFDACCDRTYQLTEASVRRMLLELDTAGNVRLEEGKPSDLWYTSCVDLMNSRFSALATDYSGLGVTGISVTGVTRVHNRWLRNRFEKRLSQIVDTSDGSYKRSLEYLFVGEHPALPGEFEKAVEFGFRSATDLAALGLDAAVLLSNNVGMADHLRIQAALELSAAEAAGPSHVGSAGTLPWLMDPASGRLMVAKVYLGRTVAETTHVGSKLTQQLYRDGHHLNVGATLEGPRITKSGLSNIDAIYRTRTGDTKQRLWYILDETVVLPEYIIDFQYKLDSSSKLHGSSSSSSSSPSLGAPVPADTAQVMVASLEPDMRALARPLLPWLVLRMETPPSSLTAPSHKELWSIEEVAVVKLLGREPAPSQREKLHQLTEEGLARYLGPSCQLSSLVSLDLHNCGLKRIEGLSCLRDSLLALTLTYNEIQRLEGVSELTCLTKLDLGHNLLKRVEGLKGMSSLQHLGLSSNQILKLEEVYAVKKYVPQLKFLDMSDNPLCDDKSYRPTVLRKMRALEVFDQIPVQPEEKALYEDISGGITMQMLLSGQRREGIGALSSPPSDAEVSSPRANDLSRTTELCLERRHIRRIQNLESLTALKVARFVDNQISHIEGLESCTALEELCLEDNRLGSIEGLQGLGKLKKLLLGRNKMVALDMMQHVTNLLQLSIEDNELTSLAGLEPLVNLLELYAGNNRIKELREAQRLRELPKLIILDLSGNPCAGGGVVVPQPSSQADPILTNEDYRLYVIYNVRKLKVLDGIPIEAAEQAAAKSRYSGRLTKEFLEERLGHCMFDRIRDMDCSQLRIRDVGTVFLAEEFEALQELNLDGNLLVEASGLALLSQLVVLKMNNNRLGEECVFSLSRMIDKNVDLQRILALAEIRNQQQQSAAANAAGGTARQIPAGSTSWPHDVTDLFPNLQVLQLGSNQIASVSSLNLGCLSGLRSLFLQNNDITRVDGFTGLVNLQELVLDRNKIRYIDPDVFSHLSRLRELRMEENGLRSLANLQSLSSLQSLHVGFNRISEAIDIDRLQGLVSLVEINLVNNPITRKQAYRALLINRCQRLCTADGQSVTYEEREQSDNMFNPQPSMMEMLTQQQQLQMMQAGRQQGIGSVRMNNIEFAGLPVGTVPSIQSNTIVLSGPASFGLEGIGLRELPPELASAMASRLAGAETWGRPNSNTQMKPLAGAGMLGISPVKFHGQGLGSGGRQQQGLSPARRQPPAAGSSNKVPNRGGIQY
ncbi:hypothetical protein CEUSTIGMA_g1233.t1 [Chlamydomonas eustigma]|uniref:U2A'/phosphoprotein 32 family A C-terminal domain-containing protein n=1 Tax=Chlamydomonas eustigma TaxID=1157962 RepID=A0A250WSZ8_9CHLO|nr:hypothetical protein CEUSTIGMA_g1233.t1 [Chlamydomonas eustigma]|eukprot:GAX73782.1 hypothetical protein CEUSTIGMA_g1233.t1 [Chlamydomonas eustigma]